MISKNITCPFKKFFSIPCPFCGMTRAFTAFLKGNIIHAMYFNILFIPILVIILVVDVILLIEIIKNRSFFLERMIIIFFKYKRTIFLLCLIMLIFSVFINWYHGI